MVFVHIQHRSTVSPASVSARAYAAHPRTEIIFVAFSVSPGNVQFIPGELQQRRFPAGTDALNALSTALTAGVLVCCATLPITRELWRRQRLPEPKSWVELETQQRLGGYPADIDLCAPLLGLRTPALGWAQTVAQLKRNMGGYLPPIGAPALANLQGESRFHLEVMSALSNRVSHLYTPAEHALFQCHHQINETGVTLDKNLAHNILEIAGKAQEERGKKVEKDSANRLSINDLQRTEKLIAILREEGVVLPDLRADTIETTLERDDISELARSLLEARLGHAKVAYKRLSKALALVDADGRLRDVFRSHGARTGRYASTGVQLQNLPKPIDKIDYPFLLSAASERDLSALRTAVPTHDLSDAITQIMETAPSWAPGLPLKAKGFFADRYYKEDPKK